MNISYFNRRRYHLKQYAAAEQGITLLEVLVSLALSLVLVGGLLNLLVLGINNVSRGGGRTAACIYAASLLEEMKSQPDLLAGVLVPGQVKVSDMPFLQLPPAGVEAEIEFKALEESRGFYVVTVKVLTGGGGKQWEEYLIGVVPAP